MVMIPKIGKAFYSEENSFRQISMTSFLFKTMEKITSWEIQTTSLKDKSIDSRQHEFQSGSSTESALSIAANYIESGINKPSGFVLSVFLDVAGAFDNICPKAAIRVLRKRKIKNIILNWHGHNLLNRQYTIDIKGALKKGSQADLV